MKIDIDRAEVELIIASISHTESNPLLKLILHKVENIVATMADVKIALDKANDTLTAVGTEVDKVGTETQTLITAVANLTAIISAGGATTPEVDAALAKVQASADALAAKVKAVDDLVPDAAVTP